MYNRYYSEEAHLKKQQRVKSVIQCLEEGMSDTKQIAEELGVSRSTVQRYIRYIRKSQEE